MISKEELKELMEEARVENLEHEEECKQERAKDGQDWDMREGDYC